MPSGSEGLKTCQKCGLAKPLDEFHKAARNRDGRKTYCKPCRGQYESAWRQANPSRCRVWDARRYKRKLEQDPEGIRRYARERHANGRVAMARLKARPCMDCGGTFPPECMDFDHRDPSSKLYGVARLATASPKKLAAEIAKCDLVCSNCHRIRTKSRRQQYGRRS